MDSTPPLATETTTYVWSIDARKTGAFCALESRRAG